MWIQNLDKWPNDRIGYKTSGEKNLDSEITVHNWSVLSLVKQEYAGDVF